MLTKLPHWNAAFQAFLLDAARKSRPGVPVEEAMTFNWDPHSAGLNCVGFTAAGVETQLGFNFYKVTCGDAKYDSPLGALRLIRKMGGDTLDGVFGQYFQERELAFMQIGDIGMVESTEPSSLEVGQNLACGLISAPYIYCIQPNGLEKFPLNRVVKAFIPESWNGPTEANATKGAV